MDIVVRVVYEGTTYDLEVLENIPLRLDISAAESQDIGTFFGVGSQTFVLPGTKTNNTFFEHAYEVGSDDVPAFYNTIQGYIIYDGETLLTGQFQLIDILRDEEGFVSYKCILQDSSVQFKDKIESQLLIDGEWDQYNHNLSVNNVTGSWNDSLFSGSIFYPVVDYGIDNSDDFPAIPRIQLGSTVTNNAGDINFLGTPMRLKQFLPAIKARDVLDIIFKTAGFRATGSFMESTDFNQAYILPKASEDLGISGTTGSLQTFSAIPYTNYNATFKIFNNFKKTTPLWFPNEQYDFGSNFSSQPSTATPIPSSSYVAPVDGRYTFQAEVTYLNSVTEQNSVFVGLYLTSGSGKHFEVIQDVPFTSPEVLTIATGGEMDLRSGDEVKLVFTVEGNRGPSGGSLVADEVVVTQTGTFWTCTDAPITYENAPVSMSLQFDQSTKSIDVVRGLIEQYNLIFTPEPNYDSVIRVETFDQWMWEGRVIDWTDKFETAERVSITHTVDEQNRELLLANEDDSDRFSVVSIDNAPNYQYGTLRLLSDSNIPQGSRKIGSYFGPTVLGGQLKSGSVDSDGVATFNIDTNSTFCFPHLYKFDNREQKSFKFRPRLGYKVINQLPIGTDGNRQNFYIGLPGTEGIEYANVTGSYGTISNVSVLPVTGSARDLHNNTQFSNFASAGLNLNAGLSNYNRYWKNYIDSLYWEGSRKVTLDLKFTAQEYKDIRLNDHIFIKDQQYRINKISGFNVTTDDVVTVELIRLFPGFYQGPTEPSCDFTISGSLSDSVCGPAPSPTPTPTPSPTPGPTPTPGPSPSPSPGPSPSPSPTPSPTPTPSVTCTEYDLICNSTSPGNCTFNVSCCDGSSITNLTLIPGSEATYCATAVSVTGPYGSATDTTSVCTDACFIGGS